ncbi:cupin domain-containing protein [Candidatus Saccharibacteria bacterium]|nr:cupin domain-containing protein [Candidatus Saccharibacteria bacterium]
MKYKPRSAGESVHRKDYHKRVIFTPGDFEEAGHLLQVVTIPKKTKQREHHHTQQTEVFYVLEGEALLYINGEGFLAKPGDAFVCNPEDRHNIWNQADQDFKLVVFKINMPEKDDTVWEEEK